MTTCRFCEMELDEMDLREGECPRCGSEIETTTEEFLCYPPTVWRRNEATGDLDEVPYSCYLEARANKKVGDLLVHWASAPGTGREVLRITRMDDTGVYAIQVENTIRELNEWEVR